MVARQSQFSLKGVPQSEYAKDAVLESYGLLSSVELNGNYSKINGSQKITGVFAADPVFEG